MLLRKLAMFFGGCGMVLGLFVLTARVVVLGLMMVMRGCMVVAGRGVMMLLRQDVLPFEAFPAAVISVRRCNRPPFPVKTKEYSKIRPIRDSCQ
jgi:hypothetical protein